MFAGWGIGMANELEVDTGGLRIAAANSDAIGAALAYAGSCSLTTSRPSSAGVAAVNAALTSMCQSQSSRLTGQAADMTTSSARYDTTDSDGRDAITGTVTV